MQVQQNQTAEILFTSAKNRSSKQDLLNVSVSFTDPNKKTVTVRAFWAGGNLWKARYSTNVIGSHSYVSSCEDAADSGLNGCTGSIEIVTYTGENPLYLHGSIGRKSNSHYLTHKDGTPFFWLADTLWMAFCDRIAFPDEFEELIKDRKQKGFTAVQIIAGLYPDMHWYDERGKNEAGYPWAEDFSEVNPAYFDMAERKIKMLVEYGITPCIVGCWGYFLGVAGKEAIKRHWQYLLARFAAYPVCWCICGEANMEFYDAGGDYQEHLKKSRTDWNDVTEFVRGNDPFERMITIHPTQYGHEQINNPDLLDMDMLQTGHGGYPSLLPTMQMIKKALSRKQMPVIDSEVCYEGICGSSYSDVQRYAFLSCIFLGTAGHTYGANGMWQLNGIHKSYGPSPHGAEWGKTSWKDAAALPGSGQIGACKQYITQFDWWRMESHPEWVEDGCNGEAVNGHFAVGYDKELVMVFKPNFGGNFWGDITVGGMEPGAKYRFERFDVVGGNLISLGEITADESGKYKCPRVTIFQDWLYTFIKI